MAGLVQGVHVMPDNRVVAEARDTDELRNFLPLHGVESEGGSYRAPAITAHGFAVQATMRGQCAPPIIEFAGLTGFRPPRPADFPLTVLGVHRDTR